MNTMIIRKERLDSDINFNDSYFDSDIYYYFQNNDNSLIIDCIKNIDECDYIGDGRIQSKFGNYAVSINEISQDVKPS